MPPKQSATFTEAELRIMEVFWHKGSGTVQQVLDWLPSTLAYNSVLTTIRVLEKKGHVKHVKDGRAHIYEPTIGREEATRSEIRHLVSRFFRNSHEALLLNILQDEEINAGQIQRLREMLDQHDARNHEAWNDDARNKVRADLQVDVKSDVRGDGK